MTPRRLLTRAVETLQQHDCATPRLDAELLLCHVLDRPRSWLIAHADDALDAADIHAFEALLARRARREPVAYITGEKEFWSRPFQVSPDVLIPRPETEHLIEAVLEHFPDRHAPLRFCDIGTGSGCIAVTLACEYPQAHVTATDISAEALAVARANAGRLGVAGRMCFSQGDLYGALAGTKSFDIIVSNPPYVSQQEMDDLEPELGFEPRHALTDEADGLSHLARLVGQAASHLTQNGLLLVETGLCGLPETSGGLHLRERIIDLGGHLRGGIYGH